MKKKSGHVLDTIYLILLLIATIATISLEIVFSGPQSTKLETSLFSILQFICSLGFSWFLARLSLGDEFQRSQRQFAISAYRRIIEINNAVNRLITRSTTNKDDFDTTHELDVINEIGIGIRESIRSSISDWADIIGNEIKAVEKIQLIREQQTIEQQMEGFPVGAKSQSQENESNRAIEQLLSTLPSSLKIVADDIGRDYSSRREKGRKRLLREVKEKGYIEVEGFHESPDFETDIYNFKEGDILHVRTGDDKGSRIGVIIAYDDNGSSVGVIVNKLSGIAESYSDAAHILFDYLRRSQSDVQIMSIERGKCKDEQHYFIAKILDPC